MNNARRKEINRVVGTLQEALAELESLRDEEQDYFDNMPENLQGSERGSAAEQAASNLSEACSGIEEAISSAESSMEA